MEAESESEWCSTGEMVSYEARGEWVGGVEWSGAEYGTYSEVERKAYY